MKSFRVARTAGWLAVASLLGAAIVGPVGVSASATDYATVSGYAAGTSENNHASTWGTNCTKPEGVSYGSTYLLTQGYAKVIVKAGSDQSASEHANTIFLGPTAGQTVWADSNGSGAFDTSPEPGDKGISHIIFCDPQTTTTTSSETTETTSTGTTSTATTETTSTATTETTSTGTTSTATTETTSTATTETTSTATTETTSSVDTETTSTATTETTSSVDTETTSTATTSTGTVQEITGTPRLTLPATDTAPISGGSSTAGGTWSLLLVAMAGLLAGLLLLTPGTARKR